MALPIRPVPPQARATGPLRSSTGNADPITTCVLPGSCSRISGSRPAEPVAHSPWENEVYPHVQAVGVRQSRLRELTELLRRGAGLNAFYVFAYKPRRSRPAHEVKERPFVSYDLLYNRLQRGQCAFVFPRNLPDTPHHLTPQPPRPPP